MSALLGHRATHRILGLLLGGVFLYASWDKIAHPAEFARIVYHYQIVGPSQQIPPLVPNLLAVVLPWVEAVTGTLLIVGLWRREAAVSAALMLVVFLGAVGWALASGIDIQNCGCFSVSAEGRRAGINLLFGDAALLAAALVLARGPRAAAAAALREPAPAPGMAAH